MMETPLFALIDEFSMAELQSYLVLGVRILVAVGAGVAGWFVSPPLVSIVVRLVTRQRASRYSQAVGRLIGAMACALLAFFLFGFLGWGGGGSGDGIGPGDGLAEKQNKDKKSKDTAKDKTPKSKDDPRKKILYVEIINFERINKNKDDKFYLINKQEPPRHISEVEHHLKENLSDYKGIEVISYKDSVSDVYKERLYQPLERLRKKYRLLHFKDGKIDQKKAEISNR